MDRARIEFLLHRLSEKLVQRGVVGEVAIYGGRRWFWPTGLVWRPKMLMPCLSPSMGREETDLDDVKFLMGHLKLLRAEDVLELVSRYYPEERIQPKTRLAIEELYQELQDR